MGSVLLALCFPNLAQQIPYKYAEMDDLFPEYMYPLLLARRNFILQQMQMQMFHNACLYFSE
jgi:hypothetical protein